MNKLFSYQQRAFDEVVEKFETHNRLMLQASTGYGKTYTFVYLAKHFVEKGKKVVVLCHREELCNQTYQSLINIGIKSQIVDPKTKRLHELVDVYICMVETVYRRILKNKFHFENVGLLIADEAHIRVFEKCYDLFPESKILGVTATPTSLKKDTFFKCKYCQCESIHVDECCGEEMEEWTKPFAFSQIYENVVIGAPITELIEFGNKPPQRGLIVVMLRRLY